jgi:hypothetical protein
MASMLFLALVGLIIVGITSYLLGSMIKSIVVEKRRSNLRNTWKHFGLSIGFAILFYTSWIGQAVAEWQVFVDEQRAHNESTAVKDFMAEFGQSTLENWQSEFLQLFSFTVMTALLIHRGSAESKDSDDRIEASLQRIEQKLGTKG